ncbi:MAG: acetyl-CoA carboxylase carboxyltransferase subunit alpha [Spirochaetes bacterium RBG_16_49_21]|nr:MAG: acetyl-CoA carboxylase carboxyltransferase subunit alpha [Spirochaetes bacterium RBG_16_49_21]
MNINQTILEGRLENVPDENRNSAENAAEDNFLAQGIHTPMNARPGIERSPWETVALARHHKRPVFQDYLSLICSDFIELHGDRSFGDDRALIGGFATIGGIRLMLIGHNKGKSVEENLERNFGMARPEGYRKALRLMKLAERYALPVLAFVDTPGAYPGMDAEERGQAEAIARNLFEMSRLSVPVVAVICGEGGSGGALGIAVADRVLMLENSIYSVISPEGCAAILWRDSGYASQAAEALRLTARSLLELGIIDEIIQEPADGAHTDYLWTAESLKNAAVDALKQLMVLSGEELVEKRFEKLSGMGKFAG